MTEGREALLTELADLGDRLPGDRWIMAQRVRYLGDMGRWAEAEQVARGCAGDPAWWCHGLLGYVHHRSGRTVEALEDFSRALESLGPEAAAEWTDPAPLLDYPATKWIRGTDRLSPDEAVRRFWLLSDPLYLTPGNERLSEHYARRFAFSIYAGSELTMGIRWGSALEQLLLRYGFMAGWERARPAPGALGGGSVVEHHHPESRGLLPPFEALDDPSGLPEDVWIPQDDRPRSASAPVPAPLIVNESGQVAVLRREGNLLVVAAYGAPEDDLLRRRRGGPEAAPGNTGGRDGRPVPRAWEPRVRNLGPDTLAGLFLVPDAGTNDPLAARATGARGVLRLPAPPGGYLLSLELWNPLGGWGARLRRGIRAPAIPLDVPSLSDLLLLDSDGQLPASLEEALERMRPSTRVDRSIPITVAWEVYGLRDRGDSIQFSLSLVKEDRGVVRSALEWIGVLHRTPPLDLSWSEVGSGPGRPLFRAVNLTLPPVDEGRYVLRLEMALPYRGKVLSSRRITLF